MLVNINLKACFTADIKLWFMNVLSSIPFWFIMEAVLQSRDIIRFKIVCFPRKKSGHNIFSIIFLYFGWLNFMYTKFKWIYTRYLNKYTNLYCCQTKTVWLTHGDFGYCEPAIGVGSNLKRSFWVIFSINNNVSIVDKHAYTIFLTRNYFYWFRFLLENVPFSMKNCNFA